MRRKLHATPKTEDRFHEILAASLRLFAKHGYEGTSIDRIAKEVGATKGLVYYYFRSKDDIVKGMVEAYDFRPAISAIAGIDAATPAAEALALIIRGSMRILDARMEFVRFLYTEGQFLNRQSERLMRGILDAWTDAVAAFLDARVAAGELRPHATAVAAQQITDAVLAFFLKTRVVHPDHERRMKGRDYFGQWIDTFLYGLAPQRNPIEQAGKLLRAAEGLTPEVLVDLAPALFRPEAAAGLDARMHLQLTGEHAADYTAEIKNGAFAVRPGAPAAVDVGVTLSGADLVALARGEVTAAKLFVTERLRVVGPLDLARRFALLFDLARAKKSLLRK